VTTADRLTGPARAGPYGLPVPADRRWPALLAALLLVLAACASPKKPQTPEAQAPPQAQETTEPVSDALWIVDDRGTVRAYDGRSNRPVASVEIGATDSWWSLAADDRSIWALDLAGQVVRIDPATAQVTARAKRPPLPAVGPISSAVAYRAVWTGWDDQLWRLDDDATSTRVALPAGVDVGYLSAGPRWLWIASMDGRLFRLDPGSGTVTQVGTGPIPQIAAALAIPGAQNRALHLAETADGLVIIGPPATFTTLDPQTATARWTTALPCRNVIDVALHAASPRSWVVCDTLAVGVSETEQTPVPLGDTWGFTSATAFGSLWIPDDISGRLLRIASADDPVRIDLPLTGEGADLVLTVLPGTQGIWIVDSDEGVGIMLVSPRDNRVRRIVRPNADLTDAAVVAVAPQPVPL
jgi:hypothetical protein